MRKAVTVSIGIILSCITLGSAAGDSKLDRTERFLLLATTKTGTMQKELEEAAAAGYKVLAGSRTSGAEVVLILEKVAAPPNLYQYFLLATRRTSTMEKELNQQAARGFRLLPLTMTDKEQAFGGPEIFLVMEKPPGQAPLFRYRLLATTRTGTMQREMTEAVEEGYVVVGIASRGEHIVILEKPLP